MNYGGGGTSCPRNGVITNGGGEGRGQWPQRLSACTKRPAHLQEGFARPPGERRGPVGGSRAGSGPCSHLLRAARGGSGHSPPSAHSRLPFSSCALIDMSNGPKHPSPQLLASVPRPAQLQAAAPGGSRREGLSPEQPTGAGPRRLPRRRRGGQPAPPCGRGGSRAAHVTRRRRLTHPAARSRAASRAGRPAMGPRDRAPGSRGTRGAGVEVCVRAYVRALPPTLVARRGSARARGTSATVLSRDSVGGSVETSLSVTGSPHTTA